MLQITYSYGDVEVMIIENIASHITYRIPKIHKIMENFIKIFIHLLSI